MKPWIWRFIGGAGTAALIDHLIPGYWKWAAQGLSAALWGGATFRGRAYAAAGKGMSRMGSWMVRKGGHWVLSTGISGVRGSARAGRFVLRPVGRLIGRMTSRFMGPIGVAMLAMDVGYALSFWQRRTDMWQVERGWRPNMPSNPLPFHHLVGGTDESQRRLDQDDYLYRRLDEIPVFAWGLDKAADWVEDKFGSTNHRTYG